MSTVKLIIADDNQSYAMGLVQYLQVDYGQAFDIICLTQQDLLKEYLIKCQGSEILLISQNMLSNDIFLNNTKAVIMLTESTNKDSTDPMIYKYQRADEIARQILEIAERNLINTASLQKINDSTKLTCVYSPSGGAGKTFVAYNLAHQYAMQSKKVLFLSLESYTWLPMLLKRDTAQGLVYLLYLIKNKHANMQLKLDTLKSIDENSNIHFIQREYNVLEYKDIKIEDMEILLTFLKSQSGYDAIVLDLDSSLSEIVLGAFKHCDVIINVYSKDDFNCLKQEDFEKRVPQINNVLETNIKHKLINVYNKLDIFNKYEGRKKQEEQMSIQIPYINNADSIQGAYFPEMAHFKLLYDAVESSIVDKGESDEKY